MTDASTTAPQQATARRAGGRDGRRTLRAIPMASFPALVREIPVYNLVPDEAVELIHDESMKILEEVGCEFRDDEAIALWKAAKAMKWDQLLHPRRKKSRNIAEFLPATLQHLAHA